MADIFLSYAREDRDRIRPLVAAFESQGWSVWWDRDLVAGPSFEQRIDAALEEARCVVVAWSKKSVLSDWCRAEANEGLLRGVLVPVQIDDCRIPLRFRERQTADLSRWPRNGADIQPVLSGIRDHLGTPPAGSPREAPAQQRSWRRSAFIAVCLLVLTGIAVVALFSLNNREAEVPVTGKPAEIDENEAIVWTHLQPMAAGRSVTVLPLQDLSVDGRLASLAQILERDLRAMLSNGAGYDVLPKALSTRGSATALQSDLVIDAALLDEGERVVATVEVSDTRQEELLWTETFSATGSDTIGLQRQVAGAIARYFLDSVGYEEWGPSHPDAYRLFLEVMRSEGTVDTARRVEKLRAILELDPTWGAGWHQLAVAMLPNLYLTRDEEVAKQIGESFDAVSSRSSDTRLAILADGYKALLIDGDLDRAERRFREFAYQTGDTFAYAKLMRMSGLFNEAYVVAKRIAENYRFLPDVWEEYGLASISVGHYQEALEAIEYRESLYSQADRVPPGELIFVLARLGEQEHLEQIWHDLAARESNASPGSQEHGNLRGAADWARFQVHRLQGKGSLERETQIQTGGFVNLLEIGYADESEQVLTYFEENFFGPFHWLGWHANASLIPVELREHPNVRRYARLLGYTQAWRAELCERASHFPPESLIACDPGDYPVDEPDPVSEETS